MYYQYSVTLPLYGLQPKEKLVLSSIIILSILLLVRFAVYLLGTSIHGLQLVLGAMTQMLCPLMDRDDRAAAQISSGLS